MTERKSFLSRISEVKDQVISTIKPTNKPLDEWPIGRKNEQGGNAVFKEATGKSLEERLLDDPML